VNAVRYLVGIDLGTSNTAVAYAQRAGGAKPPEIRLFEIEQLTALGEVAPRPTLPSVRYHPAEDEIGDRDLQLPWSGTELAGVPRGLVGELARELGAQVPGRLVSSAKSWLSHEAVDRTAAILPWGAAEGVAKVSPLAASASYLAHIHAAWNHRFPEAPLARQEIIITVPASFDEGARALTQEAARLAGLPRIRLVEEPQAAFYDWLFRHRETLAEALKDTRLALVCDVGGGTTDFTLLKVESGDGLPRVSRIAVGDHLMLGGDNMDLGLAQVAEGRLGARGGKLGTAQLAQLVQQCRRAKETLLAEQAPDSTPVTLLGRGAGLIGGARRTQLSREEVIHMVVDGFLPRVPVGERPQRLRSGLVAFGLTYASDPAITRHLAAFLGAHAEVAREALGDAAPPPGQTPVPDALLLNGGVFRSAALAERLASLLGEWRGAPLHLLHNDQPDLAVGRGAVAYALARQGSAPRIASGAARSYLVLLDEGEGQRVGVCLLPRGTEEGREVRLSERTFALRVGQPVKLDLVSSSADTPCAPGDLIPYEEGRFHRLPPIATVLESGAVRGGDLPVQLVCSLTEVGTLEIHCVGVDDPDRRWRLELQVRGTPQAPAALQSGSDTLPPRFDEAVELIGRLYGPPSQKVEAKAIKRLRSDLERCLGPRDRWGSFLLRELYVAVWDGARRRRRSADHERVWLNLAGFCLRPGFGYPLDDWRARELWELYGQGVQFVQDSQVWSEWWTLWRRVAGGLGEPAQTRLLDDLAFDLQPAGSAQHKKPPGPRRQGYDDMVRLAASLERVPVERKAELGDWWLKRLRKPKEGTHTWWALGRLGVRVPQYGSAHQVVPADVAGRWLEALLRLDWKAVQPAPLAAASIARVSGDRERDLKEVLREQVAERLAAAKTPERWRQMVREQVQLDEADERLVFGESLPPGLRLID
jgi:molecular chaperone DnaK (HSP70)